MGISCGTDIIEIDRIKEAIEKTSDKFLNKIFSKREIEYCESKKSAKYEHYAARFAAKEAVFKAVSIFLKDKYDITWKDAEILNDEKGKPYVILNDIYFKEKIKNIDISISHCKNYATANVIVLY